MIVVKDIAGRRGAGLRASVAAAIDEAVKNNAGASVFWAHLEFRRREIAVSPDGEPVLPGSLTYGDGYGGGGFSREDWERKPGAVVRAVIREAAAERILSHFHRKEG